MRAWREVKLLQLEESTRGGSYGLKRVTVILKDSSGNWVESKRLSEKKTMGRSILRMQGIRRNARSESHRNFVVDPQLRVSFSEAEVGRLLSTQVSSLLSTMLQLLLLLPHHRKLFNRRVTFIILTLLDLRIISIHVHLIPIKCTLQRVDIRFHYILRKN